MPNVHVIIIYHLIFLLLKYNAVNIFTADCCKFKIKLSVMTKAAAISDITQIFLHYADCSLLYC